MAKGGWSKETRVIAVRVDTSVYSRLRSLAEKLAKKQNRPVSVGDYVKFLINTQATRFKPSQTQRRRRLAGETERTTVNSTRLTTRSPRSQGPGPRPARYRNS